MSGQRVLMVDAYGPDRLVDEMDELIGKELTPMGAIISEIVQFRIILYDPHNTDYLSARKCWHAIVLVKTEPICPKYTSRHKLRCRQCAKVELGGKCNHAFAESGVPNSFIDPPCPEFEAR